MVNYYRMALNKDEYSFFSLFLILSNISHMLLSILNQNILHLFICSLMSSSSIMCLYFPILYNRIFDLKILSSTISVMLIFIMVQIEILYFHLFIINSLLSEIYWTLGKEHLEKHWRFDIKLSSIISYNILKERCLI